MTGPLELARLPELQVVGWTVLHSLWQVALAGAVLALLLRAAPSRSARARYGLAMGALLVMLAVPAATAHRARALWADHERCWDLAMSGATLPAACGNHGLPASSMTDSPDAAERLSPLRAASLRVTGSLGVVGLVWSIGAAVALALRLGAWARVARLARRDTTPAPRPTRAAVLRLSRALGVRRRVAVRCSPHVDSPLVVGWPRPTILLPPAAIGGLTDAETETVLAHELAHVRRGDYPANLLLTLAESLLFFHPSFRRATRLARREREFCCDDLVAAFSPHGVRTYLEALVKLDAARPVVASPLALGACDGALLPRARRLIAPDRDARPRALAAIALVLALAAGGAFLVDVEHPAGMSAWAVMSADLATRTRP